uniref:Uncharacterized protein n=1 Tax=Anguilla anguilla TaxID=7936 RepID=A0A0E9UMC9_ANGAN
MFRNSSNEELCTGLIRFVRYQSEQFTFVVVLSSIRLNT